MIGENGPQLDGWRLPDRNPKTPPRCCGLFCDSNVCTICGNWIKLPALGSE